MNCRKCLVCCIKPFPYRATAKLQRDLKSKFTEDDCINADFNHYWMHTAATLNSILNGNVQNITFQQIKWLRKSFLSGFRNIVFRNRNC